MLLFMKTSWQSRLRMDKILHFIVFISLVCGSFSHEGGEESISYSTEDFKSQVPNKNHFVMFYAPWCEHCKRLFPVWGQLTQKFASDDASDIGIARVDCTVETALCSEHDVTGYPTLKFFKVGENEGLKFRGTRDISSLTSFVFEQLGRKNTEAGQQDTPVSNERLIDLSEDNFNSHVATGKHFVKFYAPWCGHCQKLAPTWEELAHSDLPQTKGVSVGKVDCTMNRVLCNTLDIKGYPTMLWFEDGKKTEKYQGSRSLEDLLEFVSRMATGSSSEEQDKEETATPKVEEEQGEGAGSPDRVLILSGPSFDTVVASGVSFVKFFAPWCGHCKRLAPTWEELALKLLDKEDVRVAKVDCTLESNKELCNSQEVDGFPTIFLYRDGAKVAEYTGSRSLDDLYQFVAKHLPEAPAGSDDAAAHKDEL